MGGGHLRRRRSPPQPSPFQGERVHRDRGSAGEPRRFVAMVMMIAHYGEASSSTRPLVSIANRPVITAATAATAANVTKTDGKPPASIIPTTVGPIIEAKRSQAVAVATPNARERVG